MTKSDGNPGHDAVPPPPSGFTEEFVAEPDIVPAEAEVQPDEVDPAN